jgi:hypothetical protein
MFMHGKTANVLSQTTNLHVRGTILPEGREWDIFIVDGRFTFKHQESAWILGEGGYLLPGLVDARAPLSLASPAVADATDSERVRESAMAHLKARALVVREPGNPGYESREFGRTKGYPRIMESEEFPGIARS